MSIHIKTSFIALFLLTALMLLPAHSRADKADSLRQVVERSQADQKTEAFEQLYKHFYSEGNVNKALGILEEWTAYERNRGNQQKEAATRWYKIAVLNNYNLNDALLAEAPVQMAWFEQHGEWEFYYNTWDSKASVYLYDGRLQTALYEAEKMLKDAQKRDNDFGRIVSYQLSGLIYENMRQSQQAIENLQRALKLAIAKHTDSDIRFTIYDYLTQALSSNGNYEQELETTIQWKNDIADMRRRKGNGVQAMYNSEMSCLLQQADALIGLNRLDEAQAALQELEQIEGSTRQPIIIYRFKLIKAQLLMHKKQPALALEQLDSLKAQDLDLGGNLDIKRAECMMELGMYKQAAILYRDEYDKMDSIFNRDMRAQLDELNALYKIDENAMLDKIARQQQRNIFIFSTIGVILLALILFIIWRYISAKRLAQSNKKLGDAIEKLKEASQKAEDSSKMKSDFIKSISHEIRTPLNILSGFTQIITNPDIELPPNQLDDIHKRIDENTDRIVKLVNKMLELSDSNNHEPIERTDNVAAADIVKEAIHTTRIASTEDVLFEWNDSQELGSTAMVTNKSFAARALACLLENAQKFTDNGLITIRLKQKDGMMNFIVEDTGKGVPPEQAERIFDEFMQVDKYTDGAGIGLTVARSIARRLGGDIVLDTTFTAGARFLMSLPME